MLHISVFNRREIKGGDFEKMVGSLKPSSLIKFRSKFLPEIAWMHWRLGISGVRLLYCYADFYGRVWIHSMGVIIWYGVGT